MTNERLWSSIVLGLAVLGIVAVVYYIFNIPVVDTFAFNEETSCRKDRMTLHHDIVLVDATDKLSLEYIGETRWLIEDNISMELPIGGKLTVVSFSDDEDSIVKEMFSRCNPGRKDQVDTFTESARKAEAEWNKTFGQALDKLLGKLETLEEAQTTPLLESLEIISRRYDFRQNRRIRDDKNQEKQVRQIFIISDLLQNYKEGNFYRSNLNFEVFEKTEYFNDLTINLDGVDIIVIQVQRNKHKRIQGKRQRDFWRDLFIKGWDAKSVTFY